MKRLSLLPIVAIGVSCAKPVPSPQSPAPASPGPGVTVAAASSSEPCSIARRRIIDSCRSTVTLNAFVTMGTPSLDAFAGRVRSILQTFRDESPGKVDLNVTVVRDDGDRAKAKAAGLVEAEFTESDGDAGLPPLKGFSGIAIAYETEEDAIKFLTPERTDALEFWIAAKIREIREKADNVRHRIGVLSGHGEIKLTDPNLIPNQGQSREPSVQNIITENFPFYSFEDVDLRAGDAPIDGDLDGLVVIQPAKDLNERELRRIDQFMMRGKPLTVFASSVNERAHDSTMSASLNAHGLEKLLEGYGITMNRDVVIDFGRHFHVDVQTQMGIVGVRFPDILEVEDDAKFTGNEALLDTSFPAFFRLPEVFAPFASSLVIHSDKQPEAQMSIVARSTPRSIVETGDTVDLRPFKRWSPSGQWAQYGLAAQVRGTLKTAFPSGDRMGIESPDKSLKSARIFVISSSGFLVNPFVRAGAGAERSQVGTSPPAGPDEQLLQLAGPYAKQALTTSILTFKDTLDWLTSDDDFLSCAEPRR